MLQPLSFALRPNRQNQCSIMTRKPGEEITHVPHIEVGEPRDLLIAQNLTGEEPKMV